jgi:hypothetical protein
MAQKLHVTQDDHGFWMISLEHEDGSLTLEVFQAVSRQHAIEDADNLVLEKHYPKAVICIDPPLLAEPSRDPQRWPAESMLLETRV